MMIKEKHKLFDGVFNNTAGAEVLRILAHTCMYDKPSFIADPYYAQYIQGQRDLIRIIEMYMDEDITHDKEQAMKQRTAV